MRTAVRSMGPSPRLTTSPDNLRMFEPPPSPVTQFPDDPGQPPPMARPSLRFLLSHPAHWIALGFGSGLSRIAPGTAGTAWAWITFIALSPWMSDLGWGLLIAASLPLGW